MEIIKECEKLMKLKINYRIGSARDGDPDVLIADASKAIDKLGWIAEKNSLEAIISSAINYHENVE